jgi:endonuclease/exonuclease/phosphatase (EEP) superfamily protein YafD
MSVLRRSVAGLGLALSAGAAAGCLVGLIGALPLKAALWPDAVNSFIPVWLVAGWVGAVAARIGFPRGRWRTIALVMAAFAVLVSGVPLVTEMTRTGRQAAPPGNLTILTFNRWWDSPDIPRQLRAIRQVNADLVALQEADTFDAAPLADLYPFQHRCHEGCDTVILSKRPFLATGRDPLRRWPGGTEFLWVRTTAPDGKPVTLATVHLFWPVPPWIQRGQRGHVAEMVKGLKTDELVLTGDFNLTPWSFAMRRMDPTMAPLTRRTHGLLTFPATWPLPFLALDQVYAAPAWKTVEIKRLPGAASDHYPVRVELKR